MNILNKTIISLSYERCFVNVVLIIIIIIITIMMIIIIVIKISIKHVIRIVM